MSPNLDGRLNFCAVTPWFYRFLVWNVFQRREGAKVVEKEFDLWATRLVKEDMPIFARTVQCVAGTASRENSSLSDLAWSILEDPSLTTRVLKLANSMYYNPCSKRINTVSRAVMRLGFNTVKEICLAIALIETALSSLHKEKVAVEIARAFHAAVQARKFAILLNLPGPEEVFIAALLGRIGHIAFWCFAGDVGDRLESAMLEAECEDLAQMKVLGFKLERLTLRLCQEWKLSDLLESSLHDKNGADPRVRSVKLGYAVAQASEKGWDCPPIKEIMKDASGFLNLSEKETIKTLHESAVAAVEITESYGAKKSSRLVPLPMEAPSPLPVPAEEIRHEYPKPDPGIQLCSLRDLSSLVTAGKGDANMVLSIVLEGIYRGIGMDRVIFALLTPDRQHLKGKYGLGSMEEGYIENFTISANLEIINIFGYLLRQRKPIWVTGKPDLTIRPLLTEELTDLIGDGPFFAMPVAIKGMAVGVICADRNRSGRSLDEESFESFAFFGQQANMSLSALGGG
jgi:HD-like signal output (HDOD) protein